MNLCSGCSCKITKKMEAYIQNPPYEFGKKPKIYCGFCFNDRSINPRSYTAKKVE